MILVKNVPAQATDFNAFIQDWSNRFVDEGLSGEFLVRKDKSLRSSIEEAGVPEKPGVYLIYGIGGSREELLYIGKGGTVSNDGRFKGQTIRGRLMNVQENERRETFFRGQMNRRGFNELRIRYFITFGGPLRIVPTLAEAELLQAYFLEHRKLPPLNKEF